MGKRNYDVIFPSGRTMNVGVLKHGCEAARLLTLCAMKAAKPRNLLVNPYCWRAGSGARQNPRKESRSLAGAIASPTMPRQLGRDEGDKQWYFCLKAPGGISRTEISSDVRLNVTYNQPMSALPQQFGNGYPELAKLMGPHHGMVMYKRFASLNARNTLYMQVELLDLEQKLEVLENVDKQDEKLPYYKNARALMGTTASRTNSEQWQLILKIREKLRDYNETLLQQAKVNKLDTANRHDLRILREWLMIPGGGGYFPQSIEDRPWRPEESGDLVTLSSRKYDAFTEWVVENLLPWCCQRLFNWKKPLPGQEETGLIEWRDTTFTAFSRALSVISSTLVPSVAVTSLYFIHNPLARIFAAMGFSAMFSLVLALLTTARLAEILGATVA